MTVRCSLLSLSLGVVLVAWWLSRRQPPPTYDSPPVTNADGSVYFDHTNLKMPSTIREIIEIVKSAVLDRRKIKVLGAGHSRSAIAHSSDIYLSLYNYTGVVGINHRKKEVTVKAGTMLRDLNIALKENGLALSSLPTLEDQTIGGALAVGSHGTGLGYGNMATFVTGMSIVTGTGELMYINATANPELFKAAQVSLGMLGVIIDVTFQCEDQFNLKEKVSIHSLDHCLQALPLLSTLSDHGKFFMEAHSNLCVLFEVQRTSEQETVDQGSMHLWDIKNRLSEPLLLLGSWIPSLNPFILSFLYNVVQIFTPYERVAPSQDVFNLPLYVPFNHQLELVVDMEVCLPALQEWRSLTKSNHHTNMFIEVRHVKSDDIFLSTNYRRDSCHITVIIYNPSHVAMTEYFDSLCNALEQYSVRVHWAKYICGLNGDGKLESLYPQLVEFARIRSEMDPNSLFINQALEEIFGFE